MHRKDPSFIHSQGSSNDHTLALPVAPSLVAAGRAVESVENTARKVFVILIHPLDGEKQREGVVVVVSNT